MTLTSRRIIMSTSNREIGDMNIYEIYLHGISKGFIKAWSESAARETYYMRHGDASGFFFGYNDIKAIQR